jgi:hypothetical protein
VSEPDEIAIVVPPGHQAGVWANWASVDHSEHEVTVDFARVDHSIDPNVGTVVARVAMSPKMLRELIDQLTETWDDYAAEVTKALLADDQNAPGDGPP